MPDHPPPRPPDSRPIRVLRVIARLNVGGPSIQAISLTRLLAGRGYQTTLVRGVESPHEGSMDYLAAEAGVTPRLVPSLRRELGLHDLRALGALLRLVYRTRPDVLHTHAAKAGTIGRLAALLAVGRRPAVRVHTFHGHVLAGYFSPRASQVFTTLERLLARTTTRLVAVSEEVGAELVRLGVAPASKISVVPLGFDLAPFAAAADGRLESRRRLREALGLPADARVVLLVARLVQIKRVDRFLRIAALLQDVEGVRFVVCGDGDLGEQLRTSLDARRLGSTVAWLGFRRDMPALYAGSDVVVLTSDNEGTPVSLIEAGATGVPVVTTDVGGGRSVVLDGATGFVVAAADEDGFAARVRELLLDESLAARLGAAAQAHVSQRFSVDRLVADLDALYRELLAARNSVPAGVRRSPARPL